MLHGRAIFQDREEREINEIQQAQKVPSLGEKIP